MLTKQETQRQTTPQKNAITLFTVVIILGIVFSCFPYAILSQLHDLRRWLSTIRSDFDDPKMVIEHLMDLEDKRVQIEHVQDQLEFETMRQLEP